MEREVSEVTDMWVRQDGVQHTERRPVTDWSVTTGILHSQYSISFLNKKINVFFTKSSGQIQHGTEQEFCSH